MKALEQATMILLVERCGLDEKEAARCARSFLSYSGFMEVERHCTEAALAAFDESNVHYGWSEEGRLMDHAEMAALLSGWWASAEPSNADQSSFEEIDVSWCA